MSHQTSMRRITVFFILLGLLLIAFYGGYQYCQHQKVKQSEQASLVYEKMLAEIKKNNADKALELGLQLTTQYSQTPYAPLAALMLSRLHFDKNEMDATIENLRLAIKLGGDQPFGHIARIRLARVLAANQRFEEALAVLELQNTPLDYITLYEEAKGDIYFNQKNIEKARLAYQKALKAAPPGVPINALQLKQADLGE